MESLTLKTDDLNGPEIKSLLEAHLDLMRSQSPPESVHALDLEALKDTRVTFWTAWDGKELLGCAALKELDRTQGEIKSMHTARTARGKGVGSQLLTHLETNARTSGFKRLSLETGSTEGFLAARQMYKSFGYTQCGPFGDYSEDPFSVFMTKEL